MPNVNQHVAVIRESDEFRGFRTDKNAFGPGIDAIYGINGDTAKLQAIRFEASEFTAGAAEAWLKAHNYDPIQFEPATGEAKMTTAEAQAKTLLNVTYTRPSAEPKLQAKIDSQSTGEISGYAAVWDHRDLDGDVIRAGAFRNSMQTVHAGKIMLMIRHMRDGGDATEAIGEIVEAKEDDVGLWIRAKLFPSQVAQETRAKIQQSPNAFGMSVGWMNVKNGFEPLPDGKGFEFTDMKLREVTITLRPAQEPTIGTVKAKCETDLVEQVRELRQQVAQLQAKAFNAEPTATIPAGCHSNSAEIARQKRLLAMLELEG